MENQLFKGIPKKVRIVSNNISFGPTPLPTDEVEQHITINQEGRVWFSAFTFGERDSWPSKYNKARMKIFKIEIEKAQKILNVLASYFRKEHPDFFATDIGSWDMELVNEEGEKFHYHGSLCTKIIFEDEDISDMIRDALEMDDLWVLDGRGEPDTINRITIDYHRQTKTKRDESFFNNLDDLTWNYKERLTIDRETEEIEHIQQVGTNCIISRKFKVEYGVENLLDSFDADDLFRYVEGNPEDVVENPMETKNYTITVDYNRGEQHIIHGSFDKKGLPDDWEEFAESVFTFMKLYGSGELFNPYIFNKVRRRKNELIFCSVVFEGGYKSYYYLTDDDEIEIGDEVLVPTGDDNQSSIAEVVNIEYFTEENAPFPLDKIKHIIRKCTDDDFTM